MQTDSEALLHAGVALTERLWPHFLRTLEWSPEDVDKVCTHQVGRAHRKLMLERIGVPCGPINDLEHVFKDPQVIARNMQISMLHPKYGDVPLVANPIRLSDTPVQYRYAPPALGEHTEEILTRLLGVDARTIAQLQRDKVI